MELTNEQRKYLGLELIEPSWERVEIPNNCVKPELSTGKIILYFDGDVLRKEISVDKNGRYLEESRFLKTQDNRSMIAPITEKGKPKRLNGVNLQRCTSKGMYFRYEGGYVTLANYSTQRTYYSSAFAGLSAMSEEDLQDFLAQWIADTDEAKLEHIHVFANAKRQHCKFKEGDFFRFSIDRTHYGYGRILLDIHKMKKSGEKFWNVLMGRALVVSVYHIITENPSMDTDTLKTLKSCPSQFIMDNRFFYGEYEIVGYEPLPEDVDYPILYGPSISARDRNKIQFQRGRVYREIPLEGNTIIPGDFLNNGIGFSLKITRNLLAACIEADSNDPYWDRGPGFHWRDLRHPQYEQEREQVLRQMGAWP